MCLSFGRVFFWKTPRDQRQSKTHGGLPWKRQDHLRSFGPRPQDFGQSEGEGCNCQRTLVCWGGIHHWCFLLRCSLHIGFCPWFLPVVLRFCLYVLLKSTASTENLPLKVGLGLLPHPPGHQFIFVNLIDVFSYSADQVMHLFYFTFDVLFLRIWSVRTLRRGQRRSWKRQQPPESSEWMGLAGLASKDRESMIVL